MSWTTGTATDYANLLDLFHAFLTTEGHSLNPIYTGTGTGTIMGLAGTSASVQETITATFTSSTAFDVVGSVSGALGSGTVGTAFSCSVCEFTLVAGSTAWAASDTIAFVMTTPWTSMRAVAGSEYIWMAPGNDGASEIYVGAKTFSDVVGYYNWQLNGFTGYSAGVTFGKQPGSIYNSDTLMGPVIPLMNGPMTYWFFASGRRAVVIVKCGTVFESAYLGLLDAFASPNQWAYPLVVGGSMSFYTEPAVGSASWKYTNATANHASFANPTAHTGNGKTQLKLRKPDGTWTSFGGTGSTSGSYPFVWPYGEVMSDLRPCLDGSYPILPIIPVDHTPNCYGVLDGVGATSGYGQVAENTITDADRLSHLVVQNAFRTGTTDFFTVALN